MCNKLFHLLKIIYNNQLSFTESQILIITTIWEVGSWLLTMLARVKVQNFMQATRWICTPMEIQIILKKILCVCICLHTRLVPKKARREHCTGVTDGL